VVSPSDYSGNRAGRIPPETVGHQPFTGEQGLGFLRAAFSPEKETYRIIHNLQPIVSRTFSMTPGHILNNKGKHVIDASAVQDEWGGSELLTRTRVAEMEECQKSGVVFGACSISLGIIDIPKKVQEHGGDGYAPIETGKDHPQHP
jgi:intracellular sulfur oxidation DsrE/DsrF family protein